MKKYESPQIEVLCFTVADVIVTSGGPDEDEIWSTRIG